MIALVKKMKDDPKSIDYWDLLDAVEYIGTLEKAAKKFENYKIDLFMPLEEEIAVKADFIFRLQQALKSKCHISNN